MRERSLRGAHALVTGASSGIGQALAAELAKRGARLLLVGRDTARLQLTLHSLAEPAAHRLCSGDLADVAFIAQLAEAAHDFGAGGLDVLAHSAGVYEVSAVAAASAASLDAMWALNVRAPYLLSSALLPVLRERQGQIVLFNSSAIRYPRAGIAAYAASKAALASFADCLRAEVNGDGIRVLSVFPGRTATRMQQQDAERDGRAYQPELLLQPGEVASAVVSALCLGASAELTDLHIRPMLKS